MLNQVAIVGRINDFLKDENKLILKVQRPYKNQDGIYEEDYINVEIYNGIADNINEYCKINDIVGVKGKLHQEKGKELKLIAEKVTFLSSKKEE